MMMIQTCLKNIFQGNNNNNDSLGDACVTSHRFLPRRTHFSPPPTLAKCRRRRRQSKLVVEKMNVYDDYYSAEEKKWAVWTCSAHNSASGVLA